MEHLPAGFVEPVKTEIFELGFGHPIKYQSNRFHK
jgi:hypothetical protein